MARRRRFIDLFAGCGGLSLGLEEAGFDPIALTEIAPEAASTYLHNRPHLKHLESRWFKDTWDLVAEKGKATKSLLREEGLKKGDLDLVVGGPPCQGYSRLGHRRTHGHDRSENPGNFLYEAMAGVIDHARPKAFIFENVQGLLTARWSRGHAAGQSGEVFEDVLATFRGISKLRSTRPAYELRWRLVRAYQYGIPQNRPRVLLVGIRHDVLADAGIELASGDPDTLYGPSLAQAFKGVEGDGFHPDPTGEDIPTVEDAIGDLIDKAYPTLRQEYEAHRDRTKLHSSGYGRKAKGPFQEAMRKGPSKAIKQQLELKPDEVMNHEYSYHSDRVRERFLKIQKVGRAEGDLKTKKFSQRALPLAWPGDKPNITVTSMPDDYVHHAQPRSLTVREWARLQTFPDWYEFKGKRTTGGIRRAGNPAAGITEREVPQYTQIGNAIPPRLGLALGEHFQSVLADRS